MVLHDYEEPEAAPRREREKARGGDTRRAVAVALLGGVLGGLSVLAGVVTQDRLNAARRQSAILQTLAIDLAAGISRAEFTLEEFGHELALPPDVWVAPTGFILSPGFADSLDPVEIGALDPELASQVARLIRLRRHYRERIEPLPSAPVFWTPMPVLDVQRSAWILAKYSLAAFELEGSLLLLENVQERIGRHAENLGRSKVAEALSLVLMEEQPAILQLAYLPDTDGVRRIAGRLHREYRTLVRDAQIRLLELGYDCGAADGVLGPVTDACLAKFQRDRELAETGTIDEPTWAAMHE